MALNQGGGDLKGGGGVIKPNRMVIKFFADLVSHTESYVLGFGRITNRIIRFSKDRITNNTES